MLQFGFEMDSCYLEQVTVCKVRLTTSEGMNSGWLGARTGSSSGLPLLLQPGPGATQRLGTFRSGQASKVLLLLPKRLF